MSEKKMKLRITNVSANNENYLQEILGGSGFKDYGYYENLCEFITMDIYPSELEQDQKDTFALMLQSLIGNGFGVEVTV